MKPTHRTACSEILLRRGSAAFCTRKNGRGDGAEASCRAFGYLRGIRDQSAAVEFRFRDGNSMWFPYGWLGTWRFNPSEGLLLKFSGDLVYLVLIRGSNLDRPLKEGAINLTHAGFQRHRVLWVREMTRRGNQAGRRNASRPSTASRWRSSSRMQFKEWLRRKPRPLSLGNNPSNK